MQTTDKGIIISKDNEDRVLLLGQAMRPITEEQIQDVLRADALGQSLPKVDCERNSYRYFFAKVEGEIDPIRKYKSLRRGQRVPSLAVKRLKKSWEDFAATKDDRIINAHALKAIESLRFPDPEQAAERYMLGGWPWNPRLVIIWATVPLGTAKLTPSDALARIRTIPQWLVAGQWLCIAAFLIIASAVAVIEGPPWIERRMLLSKWTNDKAQAEDRYGQQYRKASDLLAQLRAYNAEKGALEKSVSTSRGEMTDQALSSAESRDLEGWLTAVKKHDEKNNQLFSQIASIRAEIQKLPSDSLRVMGDYLEKEKMEKFDPGRAQEMLQIAVKTDEQIKEAITELTKTSDTELDMIASKVQTNRNTVDAEIQKRKDDVPQALDKFALRITALNSKVDVLKATVAGFDLKEPENVRDQLAELDKVVETRTIWSTYQSEVSEIREKLDKLKEPASSIAENFDRWNRLNTSINEVTAKYNRMSLKPPLTSGETIPQPSLPSGKTSAN